MTFITVAKIMVSFTTCYCIRKSIFYLNRTILILVNIVGNSKNSYFRSAPSTSLNNYALF